jgi:hypothetical protein
MWLIRHENDKTKGTKDCCIPHRNTNNSASVHIDSITSGTDSSDAESDG